MKDMIRIILSAAIIVSMLVVSSCGPGGHQPSANDVIHNFNTTAETEDVPETAEEAETEIIEEAEVEAEADESGEDKEEKSEKAPEKETTTKEIETEAPKEQPAAALQFNIKIVL